MLSRPTWSALYERDLDLLLLDLLHSAPLFRARLLAAVAPDASVADPAADFVGAWHSVIDDLGHESDLEAEWHTAGGEIFTLLIEDKLSARCQPDQATRYLARAERYRVSGRAVQTRTILVAPRSYPTRHRDDAAPFERFLAIEELVAWCEDGVAGERGAYLAALLQHALSRTTPSASGNGSSSAERFAPVYAMLREALAVGGSGLRITSTAEWVYFAFQGQRTNVWLRYRLPDNWVELVLAKKAIPEATVAAVFDRSPLPGASLATRGTTETAVWQPTPEVDLCADLAGQRDRLLAALAAVEALRAWYLAHIEELYAAESAEAEHATASKRE